MKETYTATNFSVITPNSNQYGSKSALPQAIEVKSKISQSRTPRRLLYQKNN